MTCPKRDKKATNDLPQNREEGNQEGKKAIVHRALENFRSFNGKNKAKQAALGYLVQHFMNVSDVIQLE